MGKNNAESAAGNHRFLSQDTAADNHEQAKADDELVKEKPEIHERHELRLEPNQEGAINASDPRPEEAARPSNTEAGPSRPAPSASKVAAAQAPKPSEEDTAHKKNIEKLVDEKKYFLPISGGRKRKFRTQFLLTFFIVLAVGLIIIYLLLKPF